MIVKFTKKEYTFIEESFGLSKAVVNALTEDGLCDLQDKCSDIEVQAITEVGDDALPENANTAADIVTKIGNALCGGDDEEDGE